MIKIRDRHTKELLGELTSEDLDALIRLLERSDSRDRDRYISAQTITYLQRVGAPATLLTFLQSALGDEESLELTWRLPGDEQAGSRAVRAAAFADALMP